jgi:hypothetical protein
MDRIDGAYTRNRRNTHAFRRGIRAVNWCSQTTGNSIAGYSTATFLFPIQYRLCTANQSVTRTVRARVTNGSAVRDDLDSLGFAASKLWNIARWTADRIWSGIGHIPGDGELKAYLKDHERYADLHS